MVTIDDLHRDNFQPGDDLIATFTNGTTMRGPFRQISTDHDGGLVLELSDNGHVWDTHLSLDDITTVQLAPTQSENLF